MRLIKFGFCICTLFFLFTNSSDAQSDQELYLKAKEYFNLGEYPFAMERFRKLSVSEGDFKQYSSYYYALSAYHSGELDKAKSMWLQMDEKFPKWRSISDVHYWLSEVYFEEKSYKRAVFYARKSNLEVAANLMRIHLNEVTDLDLLKDLHEEFHEDEIVGRCLAIRLASIPISDRNTTLLNSLIEKFSFQREELGLSEIKKSVFKPNYKVAVLLPFMFDGLENPRRTLRNRFILDLFNGLKEAQNELKVQGVSIELLPYDTRTDSAVTMDILKQPGMKTVDLIIGPLFPTPSKLVSDFSYKHQINMVNPLSSSSEVVGGNPFSFLFGASVETQALTTAGLSIRKIENKNAMVFYENNKKDSLNAHVYAEKISENGFNVVMLEAVTDSTVRSSYDLLTAKYEIIYNEDEADSIRNSDEDRVIQERRSIKEKDVTEYYEEFFTIAPDSIGHIYVVSSETIFASNYISAVEIRGDSTQIIGMGDWRESRTLTLDEMEKLGVYFVDPHYIDFSKPTFRSFRNNYLYKYKSLPSKNSMIAYDMMMFFGKMLHKYGDHFQLECAKEGFVEGKIFTGVYMNGKNSNQYVPITMFNSSYLELVNKP